MVSAAASKSLRNAMGTLKVLGWPSTRTEIWYWVCKFLPSAQRQLARPQARCRSTKEPGSISRSRPRPRRSRPRERRSGSGAVGIKDHHTHSKPKLYQPVAAALTDIYI